ncbi:MAG: ketoacyl-ACP synthase III [Bacteroidaceae bacterium]|nr:ketoacyl-ACP synthase III [Bacteroidaceae bacterium]
MAYQIIKNVSVAGITTCVPKNVEENTSLPFFKEGEAEKVILSTGIERRRIVSPGVTSGDLCSKAAEDLIQGLGWDKEEIDCLVFVSQTHDYILPATSCVIQGKLGLPNSCCCFDISYGCSGWVYGLSVISAMISGGVMKKGLLLVGDTTSTFKSAKDKTARPLFGDAGTATAIEFKEDAEEMRFALYANGYKYDSIIVPDGGCRNPFSASSLVETEYEEGVIRTPMHSAMNGMDVFSFGITKAPEVTKEILEFSGKTVDEVDYFIFHQANKFMNEKIRKKLKIAEEKVPYSMKDFGNVSCATIPLTIDYRFNNASELKDKEIVATAFGVGLSWGSTIFRLSDIKYIGMSEYE